MTSKEEDKTWNVDRIILKRGKEYITFVYNKNTHKLEIERRHKDD